MLITFLGTADESLEYSKRQHSSAVIETDTGAYWLDAGEGCAHTAELCEIDLLTFQAAFISRMSMGRTGGLARLLWGIRNLHVKHEPLPRIIRLYVPHMAPWHCIIEHLEFSTSNSFAKGFLLQVEEYRDGIVYQDRGVNIRAAHNSFLGNPWKGYDWRTYGFRFEAEGAKVAYSGDLRDPVDLKNLTREPCDALLLDCAHCRLEELFRGVHSSGAKFEKLFLVNIGQEVMDQPEAAARKASSITNRETIIPEDRQSFEF
jgi:ribonuclease BN (tRNA processing enzyme)